LSIALHFAALRASATQAPSPTQGAGTSGPLNSGVRGILVSMNENSNSPLKKSAANLQRGFEAVGGKLTLTPGALRFESHLLNVQRGSTEIDLQTITGVQPCWAMFFGFVPISNNAFVVTLKDGTTHRFIVPGRDGWVDAIVAAMEALDHA